jgi:hypothetical protein
VVIGCVRVLYGLASFMARAGSDSTAIAHQVWYTCEHLI